jgi:hypothetical protein
MSSHNYYFCALCVQAKPYYTFRKLFRHLQYVHNGQSSFKIRCELGPLCGTIYSTFAGYKTHIYREHKALFNEDLCEEELQLDTNTHDNGTSPPIFSDALDLDTQTNDINDELNETDKETDDEDVICWSLIKQQITRLSEEKMDLEHFEKFYLEFLLILREGHSLPQNIIQAITTGLKSLIELIHELIKIQIKKSSPDYQRITTATSTHDPILLSDVNEVISNVIQIIIDVTKNEYHFLKLCKKYFSYEPAKEIKLENPDQVAYYIPIESSIKQMLNKPDVLNMLIKNFNENINRNAADTDLMYSYRHASQAKQHPVIRNKPDSFLVQLYIDDIGLTNPLGAKRDTQKLTMLYFQLEDLPDNVKSMLKSIGLLGICHSNYLSIKSNKKRFFDPIIADLNALQMTGVYIPSIRRRLNFAFTVVSGDHLALNDIGGFQRSFNSGQFCRHCHIDYDQRFISPNEISHIRRTPDQHDNLVHQVTYLNNNTILEGVADASSLLQLIGFHPIISLPNDPMHDINEGKQEKTYFSRKSLSFFLDLGVCGIVLLAMVKEASTKRIFSYKKFEDRLLSFEYGPNDKSNKAPVLRKKHLNKGKIVGTASQKMALFILFPIIYHDIFDQLDTKEIYICLREIISHIYAYPFRKSWLSYLQSLSIRFHCLMIHLLPNAVTPKVHFITDYAKQIEMNGPAIRHWCMRFESKHQIFKQLAVKSNNFKNIIYTLTKRHQLHQCFLLSSLNYYNIDDEGYSRTERDLYVLPADVRKLLCNTTGILDSTETKIVEYQRLKFNHIIFIKNSVFVNNLLHEEEVPSFFHLMFILKIGDDWLLVVEQLQTIAFNESLWSYELEHTHLLSIKHPNELIRILPKGLDIYEVNKKSFVNVLSRLTAEKKRI